MSDQPARGAVSLAPPDRQRARGSRFCRARPAPRRSRARSCARSAPPAAAAPPRRAWRRARSAKARTAASVVSRGPGSTAASSAASSRNNALGLGGQQRLGLLVQRQRPVGQRKCAPSMSSTSVLARSFRLGMAASNLRAHRRRQLGGDRCAVGEMRQQPIDRCQQFGIACFARM